MDTFSLVTLDECMFDILAEEHCFAHRQEVQRKCGIVFRIAQQILFGIVPHWVVTVHELMLGKFWLIYIDANYSAITKECIINFLDLNQMSST